jgi:hypothetical protein
MSRKPQVIAVLQQNVRVHTTTGRDGVEREIAVHRGMDKATALACERPDPGMGKRQWWAAKMARKNRAR